MEPDNVNRHYHVKRLTADKRFYRYHVHLDSRQALPERAAEELTQLGFSRSNISINCFAMCGGASPNSTLSEVMFEDSAPDTWTLKSNSKKECLTAFKFARKLLNNFAIEGYVEAETVHWDRALRGVCKPFNHEAFTRICPRVPEEHAGAPCFNDCAGVRRKVPFVAHQRSLDSAADERAPVLEFHLSLNEEMLENANVALMLHAMGLVSYQIQKLCALPDGTLLSDGEGRPLIISERPLTLRLANPGSYAEKRRAWPQAVRQFLSVAQSFVDVMNELGGFSDPRKYPGCFPLYPVTFKLESLPGFHSRVDCFSKLPPVFSHTELGSMKVALPESARGIRHLCAHLDRARTRSGAASKLELL